MQGNKLEIYSKKEEKQQHPSEWQDSGEIPCYNCYLSLLVTKLTRNKPFLQTLWVKTWLYALNKCRNTSHDRDCRNNEDFNRENPKYSKQKSGRKAKTECHSARSTLISTFSALRRKKHISLPCSTIRIRHHIKTKRWRLERLQLSHSVQWMPSLHVTYASKVQIYCSYLTHGSDFHKATNCFQYHSRIFKRKLLCFSRKHSMLELWHLTWNTQMLQWETDTWNTKASTIQKSRCQITQEI